MIVTQDMVKLIQVVLPGEDWPVGQHLSQDAAHRPDVYGLGVALKERSTAPVTPVTHRISVGN